MKVRRYNILQVLVGIAIIVAIFYVTDFGKTVALLMQINPYFLLGAVLIYFLNHLLMTYRLYAIIQTLDKKIRFIQVFWAHMSGMIASDVTPARSGYLYTTIPLKKRGIALETSTSVVTYCYTFDLLIKIIVGVIAVFFLVNLIGIPKELMKVFLIGLGTVAVLVVIAFAFFGIRFPSRIKSFLGKHRLGGALLKIQSESKRFQRMMLLIFSVSVMGWVLRGVEWYFIARAVGLDLNLLLASLLNPLLTSLSMVPFTPSGLGIQELGISQALKIIGFQIEEGVAFALTARTMNTLVDLMGLKGFFVIEQTGQRLKEEYEAIPGDIDELAYNSNILVQRYWQRRRIDEMVKNLGVKEEELVLDVGCGSGVISRRCSERGARVVGFDISSRAVSYAKEKDIKNSSFLIADAQNLPFKPGRFDIAVCGTVIEHLQDPEKSIEEISKVLKDGGRICITTPNSRSLWPVIEYFWDRFGRGRAYGETHLRLYNREELKKLLADYETYHSATLFVLTPFIALLNSEKLLNIFRRIDSKLEALGIGAEILVCGKKR